MNKLALIVDIIILILFGVNIYLRSRNIYSAITKAKTYQETMSMSKSAIYDQLVSEYGEQFTAEEAQYAVDNLG